MQTCFNSIFQCVPAVNQQLLKVIWLLRQLQAEALQSFFYLVWMVKVQHFGAAFHRFTDVCQQDVQQLLQEVFGQLLAILSRKEI